MNKNFYLKERAEEIEITLNDKQLEKFSQYFELLVMWNEKINLTAITKIGDVMEKHFIDSMVVFHLTEIKQFSKIIDVGTGAGFPAVPMKIIREDIDLSLLDALQKRMEFLKELSKQLELPMEMIHGRAEEVIKHKGMRESFDYAVSRAVAKLNIIVEYVLPYVRVGGQFIAWKGPSGNEELEESKRAIALLGAEISTQKYYELRSGEKRMLIVMEKVRQTPISYPRKNSIIKSKPL